MTERSVPPPLSQQVDAELAPREELEILGYTDIAGQTVSEGRGRIFPCDECGADLKFSIGEQRLECPYCGAIKDLDHRDDAEIREQDFIAMLNRLERLHEDGFTEDVGESEVQCESCGGTVVFNGTLTSSECPYCASPIQRERVHSATQRIPVDGVLPFMVDHDQAARRLKEWVQSRWFAPNEFLKRGIQGQFNGVYLPYWTYDTLTYSVYDGQRGEDYTVTVGSGKNRRTETRTRWYPASGEFQRFFDDVLVIGSHGLPEEYLTALEPWPLTKCIPFTQQVLAGFLARTYDVPLEAGFGDAKRRIDSAIDTETRRRIGGDRQRVHSIKSSYDAITFKHLLLPVWMMAYRYQGQPYRVFVNAGSGEVQGERPYSPWKIAFAVLCGTVSALVAGFLLSQQ